MRTVGSNVRPHHLLLSECFRDAGYRTAAFTGGGYVSADYGYTQGFQVYRDHIESQEGWAAGVVRSAREWVDQVAGQPFFLFMHTYEPHGPYLEREFARPEDQGRLTGAMIAGEVRSLLDPTEAERRFISDLYDGDIASTDRAMGGALVQWMKEGRLADAIVVVTSDHGEDVWDHDAVDIPRHGHTLYEEIVHVPLLVRSPGLISQGTRVETPVSLIDVSPTLLGLAELPLPRSMHGQDLSGALREGREPESLPLLSESIRYGPQRFAWRQDLRKVILTPEPAPIDADSHIVPEVVEIYNLAIDPYERKNLVDRPLPGTRKAVQLLMERSGGAKSESDPEGIEKTEELKRQLRSLGYLD